MQLPRHVILKTLVSGTIAYYSNVPIKYRALKCLIKNEPLDTNFARMEARAETLNGLFDQ